MTVISRKEIPEQKNFEEINRPVTIGRNTNLFIPFAKPFWFLNFFFHYGKELVRMEILMQFFYSVHPMSDELQLHLDRTVRVRNVNRGQYVLLAGHVSRRIHYIQEGLLRCFYTRENTEICSGFMKEGDMIMSMESFYDQKESYESIHALED